MASSITALVLEKNDNVFINSEVSVGAIMQVPTPDGGAFVDGDYWAVPINFGVYGGWNLIPYNLSNPAENTAPTIDSYAVTRISKNPLPSGTSDWYVILGTSTAYITASNGGTALATVWPSRSHTEDLLPVCQVMDQVDANGNYFATLGIPSKDLDPTTIETYFPFGSLNGVELTAATANGYSTTAALLSFLNTSWSSVGTWTKTSDDLTLVATQTNGSGTDVFCGGIITITPSAS